RFPREIRNSPPAHYTVELNSYSKLFRPEKLEKFESGGWFFYPNGNKQDDGDGAEGPIRRFDHNKHEWGFGKFLSLDTLNEYLANDTLVLGAEVFVIVSTGRKECVSILKNPDGATTRTWKIPKFSALDDNPRFSQAYTVDERKWYLSSLVRTSTREKFHIFLPLDVLDPAPKRAVFAEFDLLLVDQKRHSNSFKRQYSKWFSAQCYVLGHRKFISLTDLYQSDVVGDTLIIELQFLSVSAVRLLNC
ncbi:hypothetical protein CUMW_208950, partial [Citrus unshiu]